MKHGLFITGLFLAVFAALGVAMDFIPLKYAFILLGISAIISITINPVKK